MPKTQPDASPRSFRPWSSTEARSIKLPGLDGWRRDALRTNLWLVPCLLIVLAVALFVVTYSLDLAAYQGHLTLPYWLKAGTADAGRNVLIAIAAAVITTVGVVFSITILALTLASQQFGPRMMRNFVRDVGIQMTLGMFVATFVYSVLALGSVTSGGPHGAFVPNITIATALLLLLADLGVLIYFIHHVAKSIQLPEVIAGVARDLTRAIDAEFPDQVDGTGSSGKRSDSREVAEITSLLDTGGLAVTAPASGYLQFIAYRQLLDIAERSDAVIRLAHRPGHFVVEGRPLGTVWPPTAAPEVAKALSKVHVTGPHRTLIQDPVFAIDQLVEIAIRALSAAVNDTFTALTCIDWLSAGLCRISGRVLNEGVRRDHQGRIRLIEFEPSYFRMVNRAIDKVRQAGRGMPAVSIRLVDGLAHAMEYTVDAGQRQVLLRQAEMIVAGSEESIPDEQDRADVRGRYEQMLVVGARVDDGTTTRSTAVGSGHHRR